MSQDRSNGAALDADTSSREVGSGEPANLHLGKSAAQIPVETVAALMIRATQENDVQLLADILTVIFNPYSPVRQARVLAAAEGVSTPATTSIT